MRKGKIAPCLVAAEMNERKDVKQGAKEGNSSAQWPLVAIAVLSDVEHIVGGGGTGSLMG